MDIGSYDRILDEIHVQNDSEKRFTVAAKELFNDKKFTLLRTHSETLSTQQEKNLIHPIMHMIIIM